MMVAPRLLKFSEAIREATHVVMHENPNVSVLGLGVTDPLGVFQTTKGLEAAFPGRVIETPTAENGVMGFAIGSALVGMRPIVTHQRVEFSLLAIEQIANQAAKWNYMTGGLASMPIVIRLIIGRGWGQGPQHSQSLDPLFAHIPGLKVIAPATPFDAKGMLIAAVRDNNPVVMLEHRWLHNINGEVPSKAYETPIGEARVARIGKDLTIATYSYMVTEALMAAELLAQHNIEVEVIDIRSHRPMDIDTIFQSVKKTGHLITLDNGWTKFGVGSQVISEIVGRDLTVLKANPARLGIEDTPIPSTRALANVAYPGQRTIIEAVASQLKCDMSHLDKQIQNVQDTPNRLFTGPF